MASLTLRPKVASRSRLPRSRCDVQALLELHTALVRERQQLRTTDAAADELELNRLAIVHCQWELSRALIDAHGPSASASPAA
jgi:hypothetical protein